MEKTSIEQEIQRVLGSKIQYDMEKMFPVRNGFTARMQIRRKLKLLTNLIPDLSTALVDGECVLYVARGCIVNSVEQLLAGAAATYANTACIVLTNYRILFVNSDSFGKQRHFRNQLLYTEINQIKMVSRLTNACQLKFRDGKKLMISSVKWADRKQMQTQIAELVASMPKDTPQLEKSIQHLCPHCSARYIEIVSKCQNCNTTFKSPEKAAILSLFLPGLGDMYLGHTVFGLLEMLGSIVEWAFLIGAITDVRAGSEGSKEFLMFWIGIMVITNVIDYFLTKFMGRKGLISTSKCRPVLGSVNA